MNLREIPHRACGILLHPTSLPGPHGIGSLGRQAYRFVDFLAQAGQTLWQILPLGPVGFGNSPYSTFCSVAGNPLLISLDQLVRSGDLEARDVDRPASASSSHVDFESLVLWKMPLLEKAATRFLRCSSGRRKADFDDFCAQHAVWIDEYALFMSIKEHFDDKAAIEDHWDATWNKYWDKDIASRDARAIDRWRGKLASRMELHRVWQFFFFRQWEALRRYANERRIAIVGDMPIFVALDSVDVWVAPDLFQLDNQLQETLVAGVPPDYFSRTGQRWGNPLYNWCTMTGRDFSWWVLRFRCLLELADIVRIDHFRGFAACWGVPAAEETAENGKWYRTPGRKMFEALRRQLGELPFLAEDLGVITPDVVALRDRFGFPGMKLLQVGLETIEPRNPHLPENHGHNSIVYTGTHDNDTSIGWFASLSPEKKKAIAKYLGTPLLDPAWDLIRLAISSPARVAMIPMQDVLRLGTSSRMNTPGTTSGNWRWRLTGDYADPRLAQELAQLADAHGRSGG